MADEEISSKLGFDASEAISTIRRLKRELDQYSASIRKVAGESGAFNTEQAQADEVLKRLATSSELAVGRLKEFAKAQRDGARAAKEFNRTQRRGPDRETRKRFGRESRAELEQTLFPGLRERATLPEIVNFDKSLDQFQQLVVRTGAGTARVKQILRDLGAEYTGTARTIRDAAAQVVAANNRLGASNVSAAGKLLKELQRNQLTFQQAVRITPAPTGIRSQTRGQEEALRGLVRPPRTSAIVADEATKSVPKATGLFRDLGLSWQSTVKILTTAFAFRAVNQLVGEFTNGIRAAREFELRLAEIQTIDRDFRNQGLDQVGSVVSGLAAEFGQPVEDVAAGLYQTLSNQVGNAAESLQAFREALVFSRAALVAPADSVDLLTGVLNSYGLTAASAAEISDKLFTTIDLGRVTGAELANTIGRTLPLAKALGVSFDEVAASLAELTIQGVNAADAQTQITNVMLKLIRPTEALQRRFDELGIASSEAGVAAFGFQGILEKITEESGTAASEVGEFFNQIRGTRGVIGLVSTDAERYQRTLKAISESSKGVAEAAAALILDTSAGQLTKELEAARAFLVNDFGRGAISVINSFVQGIGGGRNAVIALGSALGTMATVGGGAVFISFAAQGVNSLLALKAQLIASGFAADALNGRLLLVGKAAAFTGGAVAVGGIVLALNAGTDGAQELRQELERLDVITKKSAADEKKALTPTLDVRTKAVKEATKALELDLFARQRLYNKDRQNALKAQELITSDFKNQLSERTSDLDSFINTIQSLQDNVASNTRDLNKEFLDFDFTVNQGRFERSLQGLSDPEQGRAFIARSQEVLAAAREAAAKGNTDFAKQLFGEALSIGERAAQTAGSQAAGEAQVNRVLQERRSLNDTLIRQQQTQANEAARLEKQQRDAVNSVKRDIQTFESLQTELQDEQLGKDPSKARIQEIKAELQATGQAIEAGLSRISIGNLQGVQDLVDLERRIKSPFTSAVSGQAVPLNFAADEAITTVLNQLTATSRQTPPEITFRLTALTGEEFIDEEGFGKFQSGVAKISEEAATNIKNELQRPDLTSALDKQLTAIGIAGQKIGQEFREVAHEQSVLDKVSVATGLPTIGRTGEQGRIDTANVQADQRIAEINVLLAQAREAIRAGNTQLLTQVLNQVDALKTAADQAQPTGAVAGILGAFGVGSNFGQLSQLMTDLRTAITQAAEAQVKVSAAFQTGVGTNNAELLFQTTSEALTQLPQTSFQVGSALVNDINNVGSAYDTATTKVNQFNAAIARGANASPNVPVQGEARGGLIHYFNQGGFAPRGTDTVPAMLTPGEFVVNAKNARKFYSQLVSINRGQAPIYRAEGGPVSTTIGDIHMTVNAKGKVSGRQVAKDFRRELRRKTIKLGGTR